MTGGLFGRLALAALPRVSCRGARAEARRPFEAVAVSQASGL